VRRSGSGGGEEIVVAHLKEVVVLFDLCPIGRFVWRGKGEEGVVRTPGKLLDAQGRSGNLLWCATVYRQHKDLRRGGLFIPSFCKKCQPVAGGRPLRRAQSRKHVSQDALRACSNVHQHKLAVITVLVPIHAGHNDDDGLSIRRNRRTGDPDDFLQIAQLYFSSLSFRLTRRS
jgi:hypothetical protein